MINKHFIPFTLPTPPLTPQPYTLNTHHQIHSSTHYPAPIRHSIPAHSFTQAHIMNTHQILTLPNFPYFYFILFLLLLFYLLKPKAIVLVPIASRFGLYVINSDASGSVNTWYWVFLGGEGAKFTPEIRNTFRVNFNVLVNSNCRADYVTT